jgi:NAD(P)-dependent dehydrogenase (short-subunit alcohol dehydrogenase family)
VSGYGVRPVTVLRQGLLDGRAIALAGGPAPAIAPALSTLGARLETVDPALGEDGVSQWADAVAPLHALVFDAGPAFGGGGQAGLQAALEQAWIATRGVATGALIPAGAGKVVLIAPRPRGGSFAAAARAALENLARTLSVEWACHGVTTVALAPGDKTTDEELAELVSFLVSPAGEYFSGCLFELGPPTGYGLLRSS